MSKLHKISVGKILRARVLLGLSAALALLIALQGIFNPQLTAFAATAPSLGTAGSFTVLAGSTVTNTGPSVINGGSLGVSPSSAVTGFPPGLVIAPGTIHTADAVANTAQTDVTTAYNNLAGQPCTADLTGQDLGGMTLTTGVYCFPNTSAQLTGALVLNAAGNPNSVFIFKIGSTLTTASASSVMATNSLNPCNVFWQVGSSATLGSGTSFAGNILALTSITLVTNASIVGRALARNGAVTLDTNNISTIGCATPNTPPTGTTTTPASTAKTTAAVSGSQIQGWVMVDGKPGVGIVVKLTGPTNAEVTIDAGGFYYFNNLPAGNYTVTLVYDHSKYTAGTAVTVPIKTDGVNSYRNIAFGLTTLQVTTAAPTAAAPTPITTPAPVETPAPAAEAAPVPVTEATPVQVATPTPGIPATPTPAPGLPPLPNTGPDSAPTETFPETGFSLSGALLSFWHINGALPIFGYPVDSERETNSLVFQWFERNRLEIHPENAAPYNILLGRLGVEGLVKNGIDWTTQPKVSSAPADCLYFEATGHSLCGAFLTYWQSHGLVFGSSNAKTYAESMALFGMPLGEPILETNSSGDKVLTQWFERARMEFHPDLPAQYQVLLGRLGVELNLQLPSRNNRL